MGTAGGCLFDYDVLAAQVCSSLIGVSGPKSVAVDCVTHPSFFTEAHRLMRRSLSSTSVSPPSTSLRLVHRCICFVVHTMSASTVNCRTLCVCKHFIKRKLHYAHGVIFLYTTNVISVLV